MSRGRAGYQPAPTAQQYGGERARARLGRNRSLQRSIVVAGADEAGGGIVIQVKRVYEAAEPQDGARFLVERLWPRGMKKESLQMDGWLKEVAPSTALRQWFGHDPARWAEFQRRYTAELDAAPDAWAPLVAAARQGPVT